MTMTRKTALLATLLIPGTAFAQINIGDTLGATETAIRSALDAQGYTTLEIEIENGEIEVDAIRAGQAFEFELSSETGEVLVVYLEDEDDAEDDEDEDDDEEDDD